jgi:thioredoxin-dependent peroxiredoxin
LLAIGTRAPEFVLPNELGEDTSLSSLLRDGSLILYFYPADFTPFCTKEACSIRDMHSGIVQAGLRVAGVSPQDVASHRRFKERYDLPFMLLSDPEKIAVRLYDVDGPFGVRIRRATYLIDGNGVIRDALLADFRVSRHEEFIRNAMAAR